MNPISIILIALSLSMDAFAVSIAAGSSLKCFRLRYSIRMAFFFGAFQAIMPLIGWLTGNALNQYIASIDHWLVFIILFGIGLKMIWESRKLNSDKKPIDCTNYRILIILAIATSIDALAVGISFAFLGSSIITPIIIIGTLTFIICLAGAYIGIKVGHFFENKIELFAGFILIGIGVKILLEHLLE